MKVTPPAHDAKQIALEHVAQYVRPLLGEVGEKFAQLVNNAALAKSILRGFVGLCFCESKSNCILFAQTIDQSPDRKQDWKPIYRYSPKTPYVAAITRGFRKGKTYSQARYSLNGSDYRHEAISKAASDAFSSQPGERTVFGLFRHEISNDVVLYFALPKELLQERVIQVTLETLSDNTRGFFLLNLLNAFFLAQATLPENHDLEVLLSCLTQKLALPPEFFDRFLDAQAEALEDLRAPSTWLTSTFRSFGEPDLQPGGEPWMKAIRGASSISVIRPLSGSLQGKPVYLVRLEPRTPSGQTSGAPYPAVVKQASLESVVKEHRGYIKVEQYFDEIRDVLPPLSVAWKLGKHDKSYVAVTPRVSGDTLRAFIRDRWESPWTMKNSRFTTIQSLVEKLLRFTETIGMAAEWTDNKPSGFYQPMLESHLGETSEAKRRADKTHEALAFFLDGFPKTKVLQIAGIDFVNPLWVLERKKAIPWIKRRKVGLKRCSCRHGDFHAGNILVTENGGVTVLDFDYVDKGLRFEDEATLEVSLLLSVANADKFRNREEWKKVFPALLKSLVKQNDRTTADTTILKDADAFELWMLVQTIRRGVIQHRYFDIYRSLLGTALLRLLTSFRREMEIDNTRDYHPGVFSTALLYLGLILEGSIGVAIPDRLAPPQVDLFTMPLTRNGEIQLQCTYLRAVFKRLARQVKAPRTMDTRAYFSDLGTIAQKMSSQVERASVYRFGLHLNRLIRASKTETNQIDVGDWTQWLARLYADMACTVDQRSKHKFQKWAERYKSSKIARSSAERAEIIDKRVFQALNIEAVEISKNGWQLCGLTHCGKLDLEGNSTADKSKNDDAFTICNMRGRLVAAVADGTGDSEDGKRASKCALSGLLVALRRNLNLKSAFLEANDILQSDNCAMRLDGACCITAVVGESDSNNIQVASVGDTRFISTDEPNGAFPATIDKANRRVLGGEPLGDIITSGGNLVCELESRDHVCVKHYKNVRRFVLVTDGAFVSTNDADIEEIGNLLKSSDNAKEIAEAIKRRALGAFTRGTTKPDNLTIIVGLRKTS